MNRSLRRVTYASAITIIAAAVIIWGITSVKSWRPKTAAVTQDATLRPGAQYISMDVPFDAAYAATIDHFKKETYTITSASPTTGKITATQNFQTVDVRVGRRKNGVLILIVARDNYPGAIPRFNTQATETVAKQLEIALQRITPAT